MWYLKATPPEGIADPFLWKDRRTEFFVAKNFIPESIADSIVEYAHSTGKISVARLAGSDKGEYSEIRRSSTMFFEDYDHPFLNNLYRELVGGVMNVNANVFEFSLTGIETMQYTEYHHDVKGRYGWHQDDSMVPNYSNAIRKLSFSIVLSDSKDFEGGSFQVKENGDIDVDIDLEKGDAIFFPSCVLHQVTPVTKGARKSLVGWIRGPNWK